MRALDRDMLALHAVVEDREGRHATEEELELVHPREYIEQVRAWSAESERRGAPFEVQPGLVVSGASWDAACAAVGSVLSAIDLVAGRSRTPAFCPVRPPGCDAFPDRPGGFCLFNTVGLGARHLVRRRGLRPVLIVEWGRQASAGLASIFAGDRDVEVVSINPAAAGLEVDGDMSTALPVGTEASLNPRAVSSEGAGVGRAFLRAQGAALDRIGAQSPPAFVLLSAGFDILEGNSDQHAVISQRDLYEATVQLREWSESVCGGRMVSVLEGGYESRLLGAGAVQHVRGLALLEAAG
jgi:acetoin utilization deacetylase AcuC-like enzyme